MVDETDRIVRVAGHAIDEDFRVTDPAQAVLVLRLKLLGGLRELDLEESGVLDRLAVIGVLIWNVSTKFQQNDHQVSFSEFMSWVDAGNVQRVLITGQEISGNTKEGEAFHTYAPEQYDGLANKLYRPRHRDPVEGAHGESLGDACSYLGTACS